MKKLLPFLAIAYGSLTACGSHPEGGSRAESTPSSVPSENDIPNFHTVHPFLFRSGDILSGDIPTAASEKVRTILSLEDEGGNVALADEERDAAATSGIDFIWQPMSPKTKPTMSQIEGALAVITDPAKQPVLVHCKHGSDRTGIVVAAYRIRFDHWTKAQAIAEMKSMGHYSGLYWWDSVLDGIE